jgi:C1A family cysteine protease
MSNNLVFGLKNIPRVQTQQLNHTLDKHLSTIDKKCSLKISRKDPNIVQEKVHPLLSSALAATPIPSLPTTADLRSKMPPIYDQGNVGSCTANALCAAYQMLDNTMGVPSRLFLYYNERKIENNIANDDGAELCDGISTLVKNGVCSETIWPYVESKFAATPPAAAYSQALQHKVVKDHSIPNNLTAMKTALAGGLPFVTGISIFDSFMTSFVAANGMVPMPDRLHENIIGGHAVLVCGYNDSMQWYKSSVKILKDGTGQMTLTTNSTQKGCWIVRNSWGNSWGAKGYFYLPYPFLLDPNLASDQWTIDNVSIAKSKLASISLTTQQPGTGTGPIVQLQQPITHFNLGLRSFKPTFHSPLVLHGSEGGCSSCGGAK